MALKVCVAGATGWAGSALCKGILQQTDLELVCGVSRSFAGKSIVPVLGAEAEHVKVYADVASALQNHKIDVLVEYTKPDSALENVLTAIANKVNVVVGTSGLTDADYTKIKKKADESNAAVLAVGNFALTVVLLQKFSEIAARYIPNFEIIDYAHESKADCPSGSVRELANKLGAIQESNQHVPTDKLVGEKETRGARMNGVQVHSVRLPGHVIGIETIFGLKDEKLVLRHDAGASAEPYVQGCLLAIRNVHSIKGLKRGLDTVMEF